MGLTAAFQQAMSSSHTSWGDVSGDWLLKINDEVGNWHVTSLLGKGGNGQVYGVMHITSGIRGALKIPPLGNQHLKARFDIELEILKKLQHYPAFPWGIFRFLDKKSRVSRHFPRLFDFGKIGDGDVPYLVIEHLHELENLPSRDSDVRKLIVGIGEAIGLLHELGYLHRDVKHENVMLRDNGDTVLIDFGLAVRIDSLEDPVADRISMTQGKAYGVGTEGSSAPEQSYGHASIRSDVYSLGALANKCFRASPPPNWEPIILKALNPKESDRQHNVQEFICAVKKSARWRRWVWLLPITIICYPLLCIMIDVLHDNRERVRHTQNELIREVSKFRIKAAELGDADAQYQLGLRYKNGDGLSRDLPLAVLWFRRAAESGNIFARQELRFRPKSALHMLYKKADQGDKDAQYEFARCISSGCNAANTRDGALKWYRKAAAQGHEEACRIVESWHQAEKTKRKDSNISRTTKTNRVATGAKLPIDTPQQPPKKVKQERKDQSRETRIEAGKTIVAERRELHARSTQQKMPSLIQETQKAIELFKKGDWKSGIEQSEKADSDDAELLLWLGICHDMGLGSKCDARKAAVYFSRAAEKGQIDAQCELGRLYETGRGVNKDLTQAKKWYQAAVMQGSKNAEQALNRLNNQDY